jgi:Family of unknown function (DUF5990)
MERELTLRIVLEEPPAGVDFAVQKGRGSVYETVQTQRAKGGDLQFEFTVGAEGPSNATAPDFRGPVVQGPRGQRFVYIDIGTYAGQTDTPWSRRLKIPLTGITWDLIDRASANGLETRVLGTGRDGGPTCGTVKPFDGWKIGARRR